MCTNRQRGYTLVEILTVLAIISILAAIVFPVASTAKRKARETQCMTNLFEIYKGVRAFEQDQHKYPEFIAGPVEWEYKIYTDASNTATRIRVVYNPAQPPDLQTGESLDTDDPAYATQPVLRPLTKCDGKIGDQVVALYPEYIKSASGVRCSEWEMHGESGQDDTSTSPVNSQYDTSTLSVDPMFYFLRQQYANAPSDDIKARVRYDSRLPYMKDSTNPAFIDDTDSANLSKLSYSVYLYDSYDTQSTPGTKMPSTPAAGLTTLETHYSTVRSFDIYDTDGTTMKPNMDRQLRWRHPPEDTVITWCSFHRDVDADGVPSGSSMDQVLFLDGRTKRMKSDAMKDQTWMIAAPN